MNFETSKNLGGIGAILLFVSPITIPFTRFFGGPILGFIGLVLLLIGAYGFAQYFREAGIFNNMLYGTIVAIAGAFISFVLAIWAFLTILPSFLDKVYPGWNGDWTNIPSITPNTSNISLSDVAPFIGVVFGLIIALFITGIIVAFLYRKSLTLLTAKSGVGLFGTTGTILLIGAALIIAFGFGLLLVWISALLLAIAFFQARPAEPQPIPPPVTYPTQQA